MIDSDSRPLLMGLATVLVAFLAGLGVGTLRTDEPAPPPPVPAPGLFDDLDLTPDQQARIDSVVAATRAAADQVLESTRGDLTALATDALNAIDEVLTEEQIETVRSRIENRPPVRLEMGGEGEPDLESGG